MMKEKLFRWVEKIENAKTEVSMEKTQKNKMSLNNLSSLPFSILIRNWKPFFTMAAVFAPIMAVLSFSTHNSLICGLTGMIDNEVFKCTQPNQALYFAFALLRLLLIVVFLKSWYRAAVKKELVSVKDMLIINAQDWKLFAVFLVIGIINILPLISFVALIYREPNPDWIIESLYFAIVSCGFWLPFVMIRFYSVPAFVAEGQKIPSFKKMYNLTEDNGLKLLISFTIVILFNALFMLYFTIFANKIVPYNLFWLGIIGEVIYDVVLLAVMVIFMNYSIAQQKELFGSDNGSENS